MQAKRSMRNMNSVSASARGSSSFSYGSSAASLDVSPRVEMAASGADLLRHDRDRDRGGDPRAAAKEAPWADTPALPRHNSGRALQKDAASGLLQRGNSASTLTGKTMSFVMRQKKVQDGQLAAGAGAGAGGVLGRHGSRRSDSSDDEYCRTLEGGDDVDEELSKYSGDLDEVSVGGARGFKYIYVQLYVYLSICICCRTSDLLFARLLLPYLTVYAVPACPLPILSLLLFALLCFSHR
jgi:hypothetical protein